MKDPIKAAEAQAKLCKENHYPHFAPKTGNCWGCGNNIYEGDKGWDVERAGKYLITGCPHCHRTYCD